MNVGASLAFLMPSVATYSLLRLVWRRFDLQCRRGFAAVLAPPLGLGFASVIYFALLHVTRSPVTAARVDAGVWLSATIWLLVDRDRRADVFGSDPAPYTAHLWRPSKPALIATACGSVMLLVLAGVAFWSRWAISPHGEWDAFAIWNLRARSIARGAPEWSALFSPLIAWSNPDYPLLLPLSIARVWTYAGRESNVIPAVIAGIFALSTFGAIVIGVGTLRGWSIGLLSGMALLTARTYVFQSSCQCADVPFGFFVLVAVSCVAVGRQAADAAPWLLTAGIAAGFAAWTKNEGQLLLILLVVATMSFERRFRTLGFFAAGAAAPIVALMVFKAAYAPANYLTASETSASIAARILDSSRWAIVFRRLNTMLPPWGNVPGGAIASLVVAVTMTAQVTRASVERAATAAIIVAFMFLSYVLVYVLTPLPLEWQIATSFDRLVTQLWPALVWAAFQLSGTSPAPCSSSGELTTERLAT